MQMSNMQAYEPLPTLTEHLMQNMDHPANQVRTRTLHIHRKPMHINSRLDQTSKQNHPPRHYAAE